jgi:hypothetical protein
MYALKMLFWLCDVFNLHVVQGIFQPCSVRIFFYVLLSEQRRIIHSASSTMA